MPTLETQTAFRNQSEFSASVESQFNGSGELILINDHQTAKRKSLERLENVKVSLSVQCKSCIWNIFRKKTLYKRLPILQWLPNYTREDAIGDLIAGLTVGLTVIPQGLAYTGIAGLPPQYGLYGLFMGCFIYVLLGTCKDNTIGSTSTASLLIFQYAKGDWQRAILLTFLTGLIELIVAVLCLGFLVEFVSGPVSSGFTSAMTVIVIASQVKHILGIESNGSTFIESCISIVRNIKNTRLNDTLLGVSCLAILLLLRYIGKLKIGPTDVNKQQNWHRIINKILWFFGTTRNASLVIICAAAVLYLNSQGSDHFILTGYIPPGLPSPKLPSFTITKTISNSTTGIEEIQITTFFDLVSDFGIGLGIVPLIALLENIAVCKNFAKSKPIDGTQELLAVGLANIVNSFFQGYRANGGITRASVNNASGVRTPMSNFYIGLVVVLSLMYLTEFFYFIPKAVLAAIIISAVIFQLQYQVVMPMWRSKRSDLIPGFVAFIACLVMPLEVGILVAIGINLLFILYNSARPKVSLETLETKDGQKFLKLTPDRCLIFPSVEFVRNLILKSGTKSPLPVVIDCTYIYGADFTAANVITSMIEDFKKRNQKIIFFNLKPSVVQIFEGLHTKLVLCYNVDALTQELKKNDKEEILTNVEVEKPAFKVIETDNLSNGDVANNASMITRTRL